MIKFVFIAHRTRTSAYHVDFRDVDNICNAPFNSLDNFVVAVLTLQREREHVKNKNKYF